MNFKRVILSSGVVILTTVMLTGCGKANVNVKLYDKDKEVSVKNEVNEEKDANNTLNNVVNASTNVNTSTTIKTNTGTNTTEPTIQDDNITTNKKYVGEVMTADADTTNPSFANTTYTVEVEDNDDIKQIKAEVVYKAKDTVIITIDKIDVISKEGAAGTIYQHFEFEGQTQNGYEVTGTGIYGYTSEGLKNNDIKLELKFNEEIFQGVNISMNNIETLILKR